jgi:Protein of unknown function (DUF3300)
MPRIRQVLVFIVCWGLLIATSPAGVAQEAAEAAYSPAQIDELVSPIALYPDALVAQILAGSTYPDQVVQANTWMQGHSQLNEAQRMEQVDKQSWDPSVKALTQFPSVLANMASNLSWTSALGDVFYHQQADVMASVQRLRQQAKDAGNLKTTPQQTVTTETQQGQPVIVIQPANPQVVYVPTYNPTVVYGAPYYPPGYSTADLVATSIISFGVGMAVGAAISGGCCGWGWNSWGCGWRGGTVVYNRNVYVSNSPVYRNGGWYGNGPRPTPYGNRNVSGNTVNINRGNNNINTGNINSGNRNTINRGGNTNSGNGNRNQNIGSGNTNVGGGNRNQNIGSGNTNLGNANRPNGGANVNRPSSQTATERGYGQRPASGNNALGNYNNGGATRAESSRGRQSLGAGTSSAGTGARSGGGAGRAGGGGARGGGRK